MMYSMQLKHRGFSLKLLPYSKPSYSIIQITQSANGPISKTILARHSLLVKLRTPSYVL